MEHAQQHQDNSLLHRPWVFWPLAGAAATAGAVILAPYILPLVGVGEADLAERIMSNLHGTDLGSGLAGAINRGLDAVPLIGDYLSAGGWSTAAISGVIGLGGLVAGRVIEKRESEGNFNWGKAIRWGAMATSALIALPSLLTGLSIGIVFLCAVTSGVDLASEALTVLSDSLGSIGDPTAGAAAGATGAAFLLPHLVSCIVPALPIAASVALSARDQRIEDGEVSRHLTGGHAAALLSKATDYGNIKFDLVDATPVKQGEPCRLDFRLVDATTHEPVDPGMLRNVHDHPLHTMIVNDSLTDYHHIHPSFDSVTGLFTCNFTPNTPENYTAWHDYTLEGTSKASQCNNSLPKQTAMRMPPVIHHSNEAAADGLQVAMECDPPLEAGKSSVLRVRVMDAGGQPVSNLEPIMGAFAHLAGFSRDNRHFIHTHPMGANPDSSSKGGPVLEFHIEPAHAGPTKFFLQMKRNGREVTLPFGQLIKAPFVNEQRGFEDFARARPAGGPSLA